MVQNISDPYIRTHVQSILQTRRKRIRRMVRPEYRPRYTYDSRLLFTVSQNMIAIIILILTAPVMAVISLFILLSDGKPVFFKQKRMGHQGKKIDVYKFRTMVKNAEQVLQQDIIFYEKYIANDFKVPVDEDPRLLKIGKFLRRWSLDELPQFINVLKGEMNIVGPRPVLHEELESYGAEAGLFLSVKPGITGLWQVSGRSDIGYPDRKYLDLLYVEHRSLWLDIKIFSKTFWRVLRRDGAY